MKNLNQYRSQREWRRSIVHRLKLLLGNYCHRCEGPSAAELSERPFLELFIPNRRGADLLAYGNNTVTIYHKILKGLIPKERVLLLCNECKFKFKGDLQNAEVAS